VGAFLYLLFAMFAGTNMANRKPVVVATAQVEQVQAADTVGAQAQAVGTTSGPTSTNAAFVVIPEMTTTITTIGGSVLVLFDSGFNVQGGDSFNIALFLDGVEVANTRRQITLSFTITLGILTLDNQQPASTHSLLTGLAAGAHTIDVRWANLAGTNRATLTQRILTVKELF
jgi:hypothetical protein